MKATAQNKQRTKITLSLTQDEVKLLLIGLGKMQNEAYDHGRSSKSIAALVDKVYRAMGVKI